jgi:hypothetical protein
VSSGARRQLQWAALAVAAAVAAVGIARNVTGWPTAATHLRDDAFYEFAWACNLARGNGPCVVPGVPTSGVQPLWCLLLAWLGGGHAQATAQLAVVLGAALHVASALSFAAAGRWRPWAWAVALWWLGNPLLLRECQNGQETALAGLLAALLWHARRARERGFAATAVAAVLARSELVLLAAALAVARSRRSGWRAAIAPGVALLVSVAVNLALAGRPWPDSAWPMAWLMHANFAATSNGIAAWLHEQWWWSRPVLFGGPWALVSAPALGALVFLVLRPWWPRALRVVPAAVVGLAYLVGRSDLLTAAVAAACLWLVPASSPRRVLPGALAALLLGLLAIVALHWAVRWYPRDYYAAPLAVGGAVALLRLRRWPALLVALLAAGLLQTRLPEDALAHQRAMAVAGAAVPFAVPAGEAVGCFNAGIMIAAQLDAPPPTVRVFNLDGVVDGAAFAALQRGELAAFLDARGIRFVVDHPVQFATDPLLPHACGRWFGPGFAPERDLVEVLRCVAPGGNAGRPGTDSFTLYWRRGHGPAAGPPAAAVQARDLPDGAACVLWPAHRGEVLEVESAAGGRDALWTADADACFALPVPRAQRGTGRLFVRGAAVPLLTLRRTP